MIYEHLNNTFKEKYKKASEAYIAVGLISEEKIRELIALSERYRVSTKLIVGIDMPTPNSVLKLLYQNSRNNNPHIEAKCFSSEEFFHPKVYLFHIRRHWEAIVGSPNLTASGFEHNIELSVGLYNDDCESIEGWFNNLWNNNCVDIDQDLIRCRADEIGKHPFTQLPKMNKVKRNKKWISQIDNSVINDLRKLRNDEAIYTDICKSRQKSMELLKSYLDSEHNFNGFRDDNILGFCKEGALGYLTHSIPTCLQIAADNGQLQRLCILLRNESIPIETRIDKALNEYKVKGCGRNVITKILTILYPEKYILINSCSLEYLHLDELKRGSQYIEYCEQGKYLLQTLDIDDFATLDGLIRQLTNGDAI